MKLAIIGYGVMGHEIEQAARKANIDVAAVFDIDNRLAADKCNGFDVAIDFSCAGAVAENVRILTAARKDIVLGTTGWLAQREEVFEMVRRAGTAMVWGANFAPAMHVFLQLVRLAARAASSLDGFDIAVAEIHHARKQDHPSGTALAIAQAILEQAHWKKNVVSSNLQGRIDRPDLHVSSLRVGALAGTHTVYVDGEHETIEITHRSKQRSGLASGAIFAARWIYGRKGVFEFSEIVDDWIASHTAVNAGK